MKRNLIRTVYLCAITSIIYGCDENQIDNQIELSSDAQIEAAYLHLKDIGQAIAISSRETNFRNQMYSEVEKQFDGEHNALVTELKEVSIINARTNAIMSSSSVENALSSFKSIEGVDYYPQVFIPYYEESKARRISNRVNTAEIPPIVLFLEDGEDVYPAYTLNENDELIRSGQFIDEEYALSNEVWVISLNETYFGETSTSSTTSKSAKITRIKAKCHKESWAAGASEVNIITVLSEYNFTDGITLTYGGGPQEGGRLKKVRRRDVGDWKGLQFKVIPNWDDNYEPTFTYANFVIFEYDTWPTGKKTVEFAHSYQQSYRQEYRSADSKYSSHVITRDEWPQLADPGYSNNCIAWEPRWE